LISGTKITDVTRDPSSGLMAVFAIAGGLWMVPACDKASALTTPTALDCSSPIVTGDPHLSTPPRCVMFAGHPWLVKARARAGAGTNAWSDSADNVWVDASGLHLALTQRSGQWFAAEVTLNDSLGYGRYSFRTSTRLDQLDGNAVAGLFTYHYADPSYVHREIDIEFAARLGSTPGATGHFAVQPYTAPLHTRDFVVTPSTDTWHHIEWRPQRVTFTSGSTTFTYAGADVPPPGGENVRMNLWLYNGERPATASGLTVTVSDFRFER
jgi:hypothetical protein